MRMVNSRRRIVSNSSRRRRKMMRMRDKFLLSRLIKIKVGKKREIKNLLIYHN
jgi:hypothetical protein